MTGHAYTLNSATQALAMLPIPTIDSDALSVYDRIAESLTAPGDAINEVAAVLRYGHAQGQISDVQIEGITATVQGVTRATTLAADLLDRLCREAMQCALSHLDNAGLRAPKHNGLDLILKTESDYEGGVCLNIEHAHMLRLGECTAFFSDDLPSELRDLADAAIWALTRLAPLCGHARECMTYDEFWLLQYLCGHSNTLSSLTEEWHIEGVPSLDEATAQVRQEARSMGEDADEQVAELNRIWPRLDPSAEIAVPKADPAALQRLADAAEQGGHDHQLIGYARAIARLSERLRPITDRPNTPFDQGGIMPLLILVTNEDEHAFTDEHGQMMMQSDEGPSVSLSLDDNAAWPLLRDTLGACYAQALAFEVMPEYGLCDHYHHQENDHA
ncbi:hypothetical protein T35B1_11702 [Salinisphaera shabanensis T35B1]|uniref:hypothetical protein n=1 Tax=Salinisphaera TaxID=180541 RepID=UPI00333FF710